MQLRFIITVCLLIWGTAAMSQDLSSIPGVPQNAPIFVDSVESKSGMEGLDPSKIALIDIVRRKDPHGPEEKVSIYIETVNFARKRYTRMFSEIAPEYGKMLQQHGSDSSFQYVLDSSPIDNSIPQMLAALEKKTIDSISVLSPAKAKELNTEFQRDGKLLWVLIRSKTTK